jgi:hypothetical protein
VTCKVIDGEPGQVSAEHSELLRRYPDRLATHAEVAALLHSVDHPGRVLADLACAEKDIAGILSRLADCGDPDWAAQLRQQVQEALAEAKRADGRARSLRNLADLALSRIHQPSRIPNEAKEPSDACTAHR